MSSEKCEECSRILEMWVVDSCCTSVEADVEFEVDRIMHVQILQGEEGGVLYGLNIIRGNLILTLF